MESDVGSADRASGVLPRSYVGGAVGCSELHVCHLQPILIVADLHVPPRGPAQLAWAADRRQLGGRAESQRQRSPSFTVPDSAKSGHVRLRFRSWIPLQPYVEAPVTRISRSNSPVAVDPKGPSFQLSLEGARPNPSSVRALMIGFTLAGRELCSPRALGHRGPAHRVAADSRTGARAPNAAFGPTQTAGGWHVLRFG